MNDREYIQHENETADWAVYAQYLEWAIRQNQQGMSQPKIEDHICHDSQPEEGLTELPF
jgi:hypothetical protein